MKLFDVAVVGATGAVGEALFDILTERQFPVRNLYPLASERSTGKSIHWKGAEIPVEDIAEFDFSQVQIAFFSAGSEVSRQYAPCAAARGCVVIDNTAEFRYDADVPLVVPEVNPHAIAAFQKRMLIANPNCSTIQMLVALKPIHDAVGIERINVATYQSVSGAGRPALEALAEQAKALLAGKEVKGAPFAFNVIPHIDVFQENGYTKEEMKMVWETHKIMEDYSIQVNPTAVRVPVFYGHSEAVHLELREPLLLEEAKRLLRQAPGIVLLESNEEYPMPLTHAAGTDPVYVGRLRRDCSHPRGLNLWIVADNVRKGAALNAVQIAEHLIKLEGFLSLHSQKTQTV